MSHKSLDVSYVCPNIYQILNFFIWPRIFFVSISLIKLTKKDKKCLSKAFVEAVMRSLLDTSVHYFVDFFYLIYSYCLFYLSYPLFLCSNYKMKWVISIQLLVFFLIFSVVGLCYLLITRTFFVYRNCEAKIPASFSWCVEELWSKDFSKFGFLFVEMFVPTARIPIYPTIYNWKKVIETIFFLYWGKQFCYYFLQEWTNHELILYHT